MVSFKIPSEMIYLLGDKIVIVIIYVVVNKIPNR